MKLTKNFRKKEFDSKNGAVMPLEVLANVQRLAEALQVLRDELGKPISINSGYRSPSHNKRIGGAKNSQHLKGTAADIIVSGMSPREVKKVVEKLILEGKVWFGGIGLYNTFLHLDIRKERARW